MSPDNHFDGNQYETRNVVAVKTEPCSVHVKVLIGMHIALIVYCISALVVFGMPQTFGIPASDDRTRMIACSSALLYITLNGFAAIFLKQHEKYHFIFCVEIFNALLFPIGTILTAYGLYVLNRDDIKLRFVPKH